MHMLAILIATCMLLCFFLLCYKKVGNAHYPISIMAEKTTLALPLLQRIGITWIALLCCRMKYYFAWKVQSIQLNRTYTLFT
jgi:hypothetical protein